MTELSSRLTALAPFSFKPEVSYFQYVQNGPFPLAVSQGANTDLRDLAVCFGGFTAGQRISVSHIPLGKIH